VLELSLKISKVPVRPPVPFFVEFDHFRDLLRDALGWMAIEGLKASLSHERYIPGALGPSGSDN